MMVSYRFFVVCVALCTLHSVQSYSISGTIQHNNDAVSEVKVSNYIDGENWGNTRELTLDRLVDAETLPTLTIANFESISSVQLRNIALEFVPVFINTSCTDLVISGNKIKSVPAKAFSGPRPTILNLNNNEIQSMADTSVNIGARDVFLHYNKLSHFSGSWFEDPGNIEALNLRGNRIEYIQDQAFNQMTKLYWLFLSYNHIASIGSEAINPGTGVLHLHFNDIAQLTLGMFAERDGPMEELYLHHNQLSYLSEALLLTLKPERISLEGNPWQCQCLREIERWLRELNSGRFDIPARRDEPVCVVPLSFQYLCIPVADKELQQTYARGLSPVPECLATGCKSCTEELELVELT